MGSRRAVRSKKAPAPVGPYSQAIVQGRWVFCSGQIPLQPDGEKLSGDIEAQTERVLENLSAVLEAAGASLADVVRTTIYLTDLAAFERVNEVYARYFSADPPPARSTLQVARLPKDVGIEIDAIARRRKRR